MGLVRGESGKSKAGWAIPDAPEPGADGGGRYDGEFFTSYFAALGAAMWARTGVLLASLTPQRCTVDKSLFLFPRELLILVFFHDKLHWGVARPGRWNPRGARHFGERSGQKSVFAVWHDAQSLKQDVHLRRLCRQGNILDSAAISATCTRSRSNMVQVSVFPRNASEPPALARVYLAASDPALVF